MKTLSLLLALGLAATSIVHAQETPAASAPVAPVALTEADRDHEAVWAFYKGQPADPELRKNDPKAFFKWQDAQMQAFAAAARAFAEKHPTDARRWEAIVQSSYTAPSYITGFKPEFDQRPTWSNLIQDEAKIAAFREEQKKLFAQLQAASDSTPRQRGGAFYALMTEASGDFRKNPSAENKAAYLAIVDEFTTRVPEAAANIAQSHIAFLKEHGTPEQLASFSAKLESSTDPDVQQMLAESRGDFKRFAGIADLKFTAADGREVDFAALRGKVVLVDFWATWCGPCIAEIPNVVATYQKYHDKGFEVIGVTLENPNAKPADTAEQTAAKLAAAKTKMLEFTAKNAMPWPQQFDGKWWKNDLAVKFGIKSIPAMVLIDQTGKVVSIEARGPELEATVKRLLKL